MFDLPRHGALEYIQTLGIAAVYVAAPPTSTPCLIGAANDLSRTRQVIRNRWHYPFEFTAAYWVKNRTTAMTIIKAASASSDIVHTTPDNAAALIEIEAAAHAITLTPHLVVLARVREVLKRVDNAIQDAHLAGELKWFNQAFKQTRSKGLTYGRARARLRDAVVRQVVSGAQIRLGPHLLKELFPQ